MLLDALKHYGISHARRRSGESDFDCAVRLFEKNGVPVQIRADGASKNLFLTRPTIESLATKTPLDASTQRLLAVFPYIEFIDDEVVAY